ncbi:MAG TPA: threonine dehydratase [Steroidobacteraceae bacterium]
MFGRHDLSNACAIVAQAMPPTPQYVWPLLAQRVEAEVWVKHENHAPTGAFKVRGGLTYVERCLRERPAVTGLISATRGNHGQSLAFAGRRYGVSVTIVVPAGNSIEKNAAMLALGAKLIEHGDDYQAAREQAEKLAAAGKLEMVPSYHPDLVLGVATYPYELFTAAGELDALYVPVGMGSGICACVLVRDLLGLKTQIVGVQSTEAPAYALSFGAGRVVATSTSNTRADGMATRLPDASALDIMLKGVTRFVQVGDEAVAEAIRCYWTDTHNLAEGAGAAPLAALLQERAQMRGRRVGVVLSGGNIDLRLFQSWVLN